MVRKVEVYDLDSECQRGGGKKTKKKNTIWKGEGK